MIRTIRRLAGIRRILWVAVLPALLGIAAGSLVMAQSGPDEPPSLREIRAEMNILADPAGTTRAPSGLYPEADFVGIVRIEAVSNVVLDTFKSDMTGLETSSGLAEIEAVVLDALKGQSEGMIRFSQSVLFLPNRPGDRPDVGATAAGPPLELDREYLLFVRDGELLFPGGVFAAYGGKVWDIGFWTGGESRGYPAGLSGTRIADLSADVVATAGSELAE